MNAACREVLEAAGAAFALPISDGQLETSDATEDEADATLQAELEALWERLMD